MQVFTKSGVVGRSGYNRSQAFHPECGPTRFINIHHGRATRCAMEGADLLTEEARREAG
jgi:hypothetical protein